MLLYEFFSEKKERNMNGEIRMRPLSDSGLEMVNNDYDDRHFLALTPSALCHIYM